MDFTGISGAISGTDITAAITAFVAMGALMVAPGFGKWVVKKVSSFFG